MKRKDKGEGQGAIIGRFALWYIRIILTLMVSLRATEFFRILAY